MRPPWRGGGVEGYIYPKSEFQIQSFHVLRNKPCPCRYLTDIHVVCGFFILSWVVVSRPCHLLEFYPNKAL